MRSRSAASLLKSVASKTSKTSTLQDDLEPIEQKAKMNFIDVDNFNTEGVEHIDLDNVILTDTQKNLLIN